MKWIDRNEELPPDGMLVLIFSPIYPEGNSMRFRVMDSQFVRISTDATHWTKLEGPEV